MSKLRAQYKLKEQERLSDYVLNQMSQIEVGLNLASIGRGQYGSKEKWFPTNSEIETLYSTLLELRGCILTSEEQEALNE